MTYDNGQGIAQNYRQAVYWWQTATNQTENAEARKSAQQGLQQLNQIDK